MRFPPALVVVALLGGPGCFSTPGFSGSRDAGDAGDAGMPGEFSISVVDGTMTNTETVVLGPNMRLVFASALGKMPKSLRTRTSDNEWLGFTNEAYGETGIGVSLDDRYIVGSQHAVTDGIASSFVIREGGPVRAIIDITWGGPSACTSDPISLSGNIATFAIYPDGRIARHDDIVPTSLAGCTKTVGVYQSFDGRARGFYRNFDGDIETFDAAVPTTGRIPETVDTRGFACLHDEDAAIGTTFTNPNDDNEWTDFEATRADTGEVGIDYIVNEGETLRANHHYVANTLTALRTGVSCEDLGMQTFEPYDHPPPISGAQWDASLGAYVTSASAVTAGGDVPPGAVFTLDNQAEVPMPIKINEETLQQGIDFIVQPAASGATKGALLYMRRKLDDGQVLKIGVP